MRPLTRVVLAVLLLGLSSVAVSALETVPIIDPCNRIENPLASGWAGPYDPDAATQVWTADGTHCIKTSPTGDASTYWGTLLGPNMAISVELTDGTTTSTNFIALAVGLQQPSAVSQTVDGYRCLWSPAVGTVTIQRMTNGSAGTNIAGTPLTQTTTTGHKLGCQRIGARISLWQDTGAGFVELMSATDATFTGVGYVGLYVSTSGMHIDNIQFGTIATSTRLGLHYTAEELEIWKVRAVSGPYKTAGDVSTNSPGDWDRISANATAFLAAPAGGHWTGYTGAGCMPITGAAGPGLTAGVTLRDAAFVDRVLGTSTSLNAVRAELLSQAAEAGTDFSNTTKFNTGAGCILRTYDDSDMQQINAWLQHLLIGYDYIRELISTSDRTTLDAWFLNAGLAMNKRPVELALDRWPNRDLNDYTSSPEPQGSPQHDVCYYGGPFNYMWHIPWSNLLAAQTRTAGLIGIMLDATDLIDSAKRFFQEWLAYDIMSDNSSVELDRWTTSARQQGLAYWGGSYSHVLMFADALARTGDTSLYTYVTSAGLFSTAGGGSKSILNMLTRHMNYWDHTVMRYATTSALENGDPTYLIDGDDPVQQLITPIYAAVSNLYFRDPYLTSHIERTWSGAPPYPTGNPPGGAMYWGGDQGELPGILFQFGQLEGVVWPYDPVVVSALPASFPSIFLLPAPTQVGSIRGGGTLQGGTRQ